MLVTEFPMVTLVRAEQRENASSGIICTLSPILSVARDVQFKNAGSPELPIEVQSVALKLTSVRPEQLLNADWPMLVTEFGMVTLVRREQSENARSPMLVTEFPMVRLVRREQLLNA
jgi:hypothetical protein